MLTLWTCYEKSGTNVLMERSQFLLKPSLIWDDLFGLKNLRFKKIIWVFFFSELYAPRQPRKFYYGSVLATPSIWKGLLKRLANSPTPLPKPEVPSMKSEWRHVQKK